MSHHDAAAVNALPESDGEGVACQLAFEEAVGTPAQLLRREADEAAMGCQRRQCIGKAETVGQKDVRTLLTIFVAVEGLTEERVTQPRFGRDNDRLVGVPAGTGEVPAPLGNVLLHFFILGGVVLLHPRVLDGSFEIEDIVRVVAQQMKILPDGLGDVLADGGLDVPVPLRVEVGIGDHVGRSGFVLG